MQQALRELQPEFRERNWPEIHIGVGIDTGRMSVGNMGSGIRLVYTVTGEAMNPASRPEGITKEYGADIIVDVDTHKAVRDIVFLELDRVRVEGKDVAVAIYEPLGLPGAGGSGRMRERELFHEAPALYRARRWDEAEAAMRRLNQDGHGVEHCAASSSVLLTCARIRPVLTGTAHSLFTIK